MPTLTNVFEVVVSGLVGLQGGGSKRVQNIFHYHQTTGTDPVTPANVADHVNNDVFSVIAPLLSVDYVGEFVACRLLDNAESQYQNDDEPPDDGEVTGDRLPNDMAVVYLLRTAVRGRNFRGSKHFGPIGESATTKDELSTAAVTAWADVTAILTAAITVSTETLVPCIVSKSLSQLKTNPTTIIGADLTQALLNKTLGTMRRRREKTIR